MKLNQPETYAICMRLAVNEKSINFNFHNIRIKRYWHQVTTMYDFVLLSPEIQQHTNKCTVSFVIG